MTMNRAQWDAAFEGDFDNAMLLLSRWHLEDAAEHARFYRSTCERRTADLGLAPQQARVGSAIWYASFAEFCAGQPVETCLPELLLQFLAIPALHGLLDEEPHFERVSGDLFGYTRCVLETICEHFEESPLPRLILANLIGTPTFEAAFRQIAALGPVSESDLRWLDGAWQIAQSLAKSQFKFAKLLLQEAYDVEPPRNQYDSSCMRPLDDQKKRQQLREQERGISTVATNFEEDHLRQELGNWRLMKEYLAQGRRIVFTKRIDVPNARQFVETMPATIRKLCLSNPTYRQAMMRLIQSVPPELAAADNLYWMAGLKGS